jgi:phospholipid/cholesterol/gamma-HCH transport system substrate-binding protein
MANKPKGYIQEILTGIFVLAVVLLLGYFTIVISGNNLFQPKTENEYTVAFENVGALKIQDPVFVRGLKVGNVQKMELRQDGVLVTFRMDKSVALREDYRITVGQTSLLGGTCLEVMPGMSNTLLVPSTALVGEHPGNLVADLNGLVNDLRDSFEPTDLRETISNARVVSQELAVLTQRVNRGEGLVGELLAPKSPLEEDLKAIVSNLRTASDQLNVADNLVGKLLHTKDTAFDDLTATMQGIRMISERLVAGKGALGGLLSEDAELSQNIDAMIVNLRSFSEKLTAENSMVGQMLAEDSALISDLNATIENLNAITSTVAEGKGTIGKLVYDDTIAVETEAVIKDVRQIIDNLRDTAPVTSFTSIFFGGF